MPWKQTHVSNVLNAVNWFARIMYVNPAVHIIKRMLLLRPRPNKPKGVPFDRYVSDIC